MTGSAAASPPSDRADRSTSIAAGIAAFLGQQMPAAGDLTVSLIDRAQKGHSGQNWIVEASWRDGGVAARRRFVIRRQSLGGAWDNAREREFRVLQILNGQSEVPSPEALWLDTTGAWLGRPFFVTEWCEGDADYRLFSNPARPEPERVVLMRQHIEAMVAIHAVPWERLGIHGALAADRDPRVSSVSIDDPTGRQLGRLEGRLEALGRKFEPGPIVVRALGWLAEAKPSSSQLCLVHGDFGPHNTLVQGTKITAILDWEFAEVSDPMQDLAWFTIRNRSLRDNFSQGFCSVERCCELYSELSGVHPDAAALRWWQVFGLCRTVTGRAGYDAPRASTEAPARPIPEDESLLAGLLARTQ